MTATGFTDFYDAQTARQIATGGAAPLGVVLTEINYIKTQIDTVTVSGALTLTVTNVTPMTQQAVYYEAWTDPNLYQDDPHNLARLRMDQVILYFTRNGYSVRRQREGVANRLQWVIRW